MAYHQEHAKRKDDMVLKRVEIANFRGIAHETLDLEPQQTVLIGVNGSGKTTVLDAINLAVQPLVRAFSGEKAIAGSASDVRIGETVAQIKIALAFKFVIDSDGIRRDDWTVGVPSSVGSPSGEPGPLGRSDGIDLSYNLEAHLDQFEGRIPVVVYYGQGRDFRLDNSSHFDARSVASAYAPTGSSYGDFVAWFDETDADEARQQRDGSREYSNPALRAVKEAVEKATSYQIRFRNAQPRGLRIIKEGIELADGQLSTGERVMVFLLGDIARRLAIVNSDDPLTGWGLVLIDELELHLHPAWQRRILPLLTRTFPNCQFVVATHSPQVVGEVPKQCLRNVYRDGDATCIDTVQDNTFGRDSSWLLDTIFDTTSMNADLKQQLADIDDMTEGGDLDRASGQIESVINTLGYEPSSLTIRRNRIARRASRAG